jgi:hypothetical protein
MNFCTYFGLGGDSPTHLQGQLHRNLVTHFFEFILQRGVLRTVQQRYEEHAAHNELPANEYSFFDWNCTPLLLSTSRSPYDMIKLGF